MQLDFSSMITDHTFAQPDEQQMHPCTWTF